MITSIIGGSIIAWGVYAIVGSIYMASNDPSVGFAAQIAVMLGILAVLIGGLVVMI